MKVILMKKKNKKNPTHKPYFFNSHLMMPLPCRTDEVPQIIPQFVWWNFIQTVSEFCFVPWLLKNTISLIMNKILKHMESST
jgi:hypothetical protein